MDWLVGRGGGDMTQWAGLSFYRACDEDTRRGGGLGRKGVDRAVNGIAQEDPIVCRCEPVHDGGDVFLPLHTAVGVAVGGNCTFLGCSIDQIANRCEGTCSPP